MIEPVSCTSMERQTTGLIYFIGVVAKYSKMIFWVTAFALLLSIVSSVLLPAVYNAKVLVLPAGEDKGLRNAMLSQMGGLAILAGDAFGGGTLSDLYVGMLNSDALKDQVIDRLKLMAVYDKEDREDAYKVLAKRVSITSGKKDGIITIAAEDHDPERAADLANTYVDELGKMAIRLKVTGASQSRTFLEDRLNSAKAALVKAEESLKDFQSRNKAVQFTAQAEATIKGVAELRAELALQEVQLMILRRSLTDSNQKVKNLAASVAGLKGQVAKLEGAENSSSIPSVGAVPAIGQAYVRLMREFKLQETLVELLTKQYELASITEANEVSPLQVLQQGRVPSQPIKPKRGFIIVMVTLTGFLFSIVAAFVIERISAVSLEEKRLWKELKFYRPFTGKLK